MVAHDGFLGCPPIANAACGCKKACCGRKKYIQPLRPKSFKPERHYIPPTVPMDSGTVYKNSFYKIGPAEICRMKPFLPVNSLQPSKSKIDDHTIMKMSFPQHSEKCKRNPILPHNRSMLGNGRMQDYTTQKHDYVAKPQCKRQPIIQETNIKSNDVPLESDTVQKLSFIPPDASSLSMAKSFKPFYEYKRPEVPMDDKTTHKLSFMSVCPSIKEECPWANRVSIQTSNSPFEQATTYKLSYIPNSSGTQKPKPLRVGDNQGLVTNAKWFDDHTIYKQSFFQPDGYCKRSPILPILQLKKSDAKMNSDSVYHLSYPGHLGIQKPSPILPHSRFLLGRGPLDDLSTQRRDFVDKPLCRRCPILPIGQMEKPDAPLENQTTMQLSYMQPTSGSRSTPFRPKDGVTPANVPMDSETIHKLSFVPVIAPKREYYPWMKRQTHNSEAPMDFDTTQHLSFMPPGQLIESESGCYCSHPGECMSNEFPKADAF